MNLPATIERLYEHVNTTGSPLSIGELFPNMPKRTEQQLVQRNGCATVGTLACASFRLADERGPESLFPTVSISGMTFDNPAVVFGPDSGIDGAARVELTYGLRTSAATTIVHIRATRLLGNAPEIPDDGITWATSASWVNIVPPYKDGNRIKPGSIERFAMPLHPNGTELVAVERLREPFDPLLSPLIHSKPDSGKVLEQTTTRATFLKDLIGYLLRPETFLARHPRVTDSDIVVLRGNDSPAST